MVIDNAVLVFKISVYNMFWFFDSYAVYSVFKNSVSILFGFSISNLNFDLILCFCTRRIKADKTECSTPLEVAGFSREFSQYYSFFMSCGFRLLQFCFVLI